MVQPKLFLPGPTEVQESLRLAMTKPMIGHRGNDYAALHHDIVASLQQFCGTQHQVLIFTSSATGVMEACIRNGVAKRVLHVVIGAFSDRWVEISRACGKDVEAVHLSYGAVASPATYAEALKSHPYDAVTITHNETSTGVINPLVEICATIRSAQPEALIFVDAVSSFGGTVTRPDELGIDVLLFGTQKCLALPPGLAFAIVSQRALERSATMTDKGYYFDFVEMNKSAQKDQTPSTPAISLMYAVAEQLKRMCAEGMEARAGRHQAMATQVQQWFAAHPAFTFVAPDDFRSPTLTAVATPHGFDVAAFRSAVKDGGYAIADGYGPLKGKGLRIGHMGDWQPADVQKLLAIMEGALKNFAH